MGIVRTSLMNLLAPGWVVGSFLFNSAWDERNVFVSIYEITAKARNTVEEENSSSTGRGRTQDTPFLARVTKTHVEVGVRRARLPLGVAALNGLEGARVLGPAGAACRRGRAKGRPESGQAQAKHHLIVLCDAHSTKTFILRQALCVRACGEAGGVRRVSECRARARRRRAASRSRGKVVVERGHKTRGRRKRRARTRAGAGGVRAPPRARRTWKSRRPRRCAAARVSGRRVWVRVELRKGKERDIE